MINFDVIQRRNPKDGTVKFYSQAQTSEYMTLEDIAENISRECTVTVHDIKAVLSALEKTPPELYADIVKNGIYLTGGGALLRGLDKRLTDKIKIPFHVADDPLHSVAKGAGIALKNVDRFSFLMR